MEDTQTTFYPELDTRDRQFTQQTTIQMGQGETLTSSEIMEGFSKCMSLANMVILEHLVQKEVIEDQLLPFLARVCSIIQMELEGTVMLGKKYLMKLLN